MLRWLTHRVFRAREVQRSEQTDRWDKAMIDDVISNTIETRRRTIVVNTEEPAPFIQTGCAPRLKGEYRTRFLSGRAANAPPAMGSRWRFVLFNPLSLCAMLRLQHVADECWAHVVLCPGTRLRVRDNRDFHTEKLRGGYWALHFGRKRGPCTNSSAGRTMIFSRRIKRHDLYGKVPARVVIRGKW